MEKYVEIRIAAHKLCDSSHNFMDRGIKRGKAVHTNTVILVSADAGDGKGKCGFTVILCCCKEKSMILHTTKKTFWGNVFFVSLLYCFERRSMKLFLGNMSY